MLELLYVWCVLLLAIYGMNSFVFTLIYWLKPNPQPSPLLGASPFSTMWGSKEDDDNWPIVTVQLPIYNELYVVERLLAAMSQLDYPSARLQIQIVDDSTDETRQIVDRAAARLRATGMWIEVCRRANRKGYKGGALAEATPMARGEFIAIFDADFIPPPDFLRRTLPHFADAQIGCVQARWGHTNDDYSLLTRVQAAGIDGHFIVEQAARNRMGWFMSFNGSAGVWRKACITAAGGWSGDTLTEDLDLSFRAQLQGWRFKFLSEVVVPGELPAQIDAYKRQQFRWAKGSVQTLKKLLPLLWQAPLPLMVKLQATLQLSGYLMHPLMVTVFLLSLVIALPDLPLLGFLPILLLSLIGHMSMYATALRLRVRGVWPILKLLLMLIVLGTGMSINNTRAAFEALLGIRSGFRRTPKFDLRTHTDRWLSNRYALSYDPIVWLEVMAACVAFIMYAQPSQISESVLIYASGYGYVAFLSLWQAVGRLRTRGPIV